MPDLKEDPSACPLCELGRDLPPHRRRLLLWIDWGTGLIAVAALVAAVLSSDTAEEALLAAVLVLAGRELARLGLARLVRR